MKELLVPGVLVLEFFAEDAKLCVILAINDQDVDHEATAVCVYGQKQAALCHTDFCVNDRALT